MSKIPPAGTQGNSSVSTVQNQPPAAPPDVKSGSKPAENNTLSAKDREALQQQATARKSEQDVSALSRKIQLQNAPVAATNKPQFSSAPTAAAIKQNLDGIQVGTKTTRLPGEAPNTKELNELAGANTPSKREAFKPVQVAYQQKAKLDRKVINQEARLESQKQVVSERKSELTNATEARTKAQTAFENAQQKKADAKSPEARTAAAQEFQQSKVELRKATNSEQRAIRRLTNAEQKLSQVEKNLTETKKQIPAAEEKLKETSENLQKWVKDNSIRHNSEIRGLNKEIKEARSSLGKLNKARHPDTEKIKQTEDKIKQLESEKADATKRIQSAANNFKPLAPVERNLYNVNVDGKTVQMHDNVIAYAASTPKGMEGSAAGDSKAVVRTTVDRSNLSADKKEILKRVSAHEGSFSTINTWDRAVVTAGFIQWTTGEKGNGSLVGLLKDLKTRQPDVFQNRYQKYGIDVDDNEMKVTQTDGTVLKGAAAAKAIQTDPKLAAVLSAAGTDSQVQDHQVAHAARTKIDAVRNRQVTVDGQTVRLSSIISSKYAVGVMMDRAVHSGEGRVDDAARAGLRRFLEDNKGANLNDAAVQAKAQKYVAEELAKIDAKRARSFDDLSKDAGSFQP